MQLLSMLTQRKRLVKWVGVVSERASWSFLLIQQDVPLPSDCLRVHGVPVGFVKKLFRSSLFVPFGWRLSSPIRQEVVGRHLLAALDMMPRPVGPNKAPSHKTPKHQPTPSGTLVALMCSKSNSRTHKGNGSSSLRFTANTQLRPGREKCRASDKDETKTKTKHVDSGSVDFLVLWLSFTYNCLPPRSKRNGQKLYAAVATL